MNERIKELMRQSGAYDYYEINEGVEGDEKPMKKFAELIIRECSGILRKEADSQWEGREGRLLKAMASWIEQHFGVER